jgi:hypothetical protein
MQLIVRTLSGDAFEFDIKPQDTVATLKRMIEQQHGIPWSEQIVLAVDGTAAFLKSLQVHPLTVLILYTTKVRSHSTIGSPSQKPTFTQKVSWLHQSKKEYNLVLKKMLT